MGLEAADLGRVGLAGFGAAVAGEAERGLPGQDHRLGGVHVVAALAVAPLTRYCAMAAVAPEVVVVLVAFGAGRVPTVRMPTDASLSAAGSEAGVVLHAANEDCQDHEHHHDRDSRTVPFHFVTPQRTSTGISATVFSRAPSAATVSSSASVSSTHLRHLRDWLRHARAGAPEIAPTSLLAYPDETGKCQDRHVPADRRRGQAEHLDDLAETEFPAAQEHEDADPVLVCQRFGDGEELAHPILYFANYEHARISYAAGEPNAMLSRPSSETDPVVID